MVPPHWNEALNPWGSIGSSWDTSSWLFESFHSQMLFRTTKTRYNATLRLFPFKNKTKNWLLKIHLKQNCLLSLHPSNQYKSQPSTNATTVNKRHVWRTPGLWCLKIIISFVCKGIEENVFFFFFVRLNTTTKKKEFTENIVKGCWERGFYCRKVADFVLR